MPQPAQAHHRKVEPGCRFGTERPNSWQSRTGVYSSRSDVPPPAGLKPLSSYRLANNYLKFVTNEKQLVALRQRFEKYTGPVTNAGGVK